MTTTTFPTTPSKKALTDDVRSAIDASNTHRDAIVPEDLSLALQALGSRVRKSVTEGYNTQRVTTFTVPSTPYSSPTKPATTQSTPTPIFRTAIDTFNSVFPAGSPRVPLTPSPKKRPRGETDLNDAEARRNLDGDVEMDGDDVDSDEDPILVILGPDANANAFSLPRKIKPLRRRVPQNHCMPIDPFAFTSQVVSADPSPLAAPLGPMQDGMDLSEGGNRAVA